MSDRGYQPDLSSSTIVKSLREEPPESHGIEVQKRRNLLLAIVLMVAGAAAVAFLVFFLR